MHCKKFLPAAVLVIFLFILGCETAKGFKEDVKNTWHNVQGAGSWVKKADDWVKKNLW